MGTQCILLGLGESGEQQWGSGELVTGLNSLHLALERRQTQAHL